MIKKTWIVSIFYASLLLLFAVTVYAVTTGSGVFPGGLNSFQDGDTINAGDWNAIEGYLGAQGTASTTSITYKLTNASSVDPGHLHSIPSIQNLSGANLSPFQFIFSNTLAPTNTSAGLFIYASSTFNSTLQINNRATTTATSTVRGFRVYEDSTPQHGVEIIPGATTTFRFF